MDWSRTELLEVTPKVVTLVNLDLPAIVHLPSDHRLLQHHTVLHPLDQFVLRLVDTLLDTVLLLLSVCLRNVHSMLINLLFNTVLLLWARVSDLLLWARVLEPSITTSHLRYIQISLYFKYLFIYDISLLLPSIKYRRK